MRGRHGVTAFILCGSSAYVEARRFCSAANCFKRGRQDRRQLMRKSATYGARWRHVRRMCEKGGSAHAPQPLYRSRNGTIRRLPDGPVLLYCFSPFWHRLAIVWQGRPFRMGAYALQYRRGSTALVSYHQVQ